MIGTTKNSASLRPPTSALLPPMPSRVAWLYRFKRLGIGLLDSVAGWVSWLDMPSAPFVTAPSATSKSASQIKARICSRIVAIHAAIGTPMLTIARAVTILELIRTQKKTAPNLALQQRAFTKLYRLLSKRVAAERSCDDADKWQPLLLLMASRLADVPTALQREQILQLLADAMHDAPRLQLAEALTTQLWGLPASQTPRIFDIIEQFLQRSGSNATHVDLYLELVDVMQIPSCRQRARTTIYAGLALLDDAVDTRRRISARLMSSDPTQIETQAIWFNM